VRLVLLSDTHGHHDALAVPGGDVLVHAGDFTHGGSLEEVAAFGRFLAGLPHPRKVVVAGNHDFALQQDPERARDALGACDYLEDGSAVIGGVRFHGSPWQPWFLDWAFNLPRGPALAAHWDLIPDDTDVLVTHTPPLGRGDSLADGTAVGCADLAAAVARVAPRLHVFGHIHEDAGRTRTGATTFVNAACCDLSYRLARPPVVFDL